HLNTWMSDVTAGGEYITLAGDAISNGMEAHHIVRKSWLEKIEGLGSFNLDDVPAFAVDLRTHRGKGESIEIIIFEKLSKERGRLSRTRASELFYNAYMDKKMKTLLGDDVAENLANIAQNFILTAR